MTNYTIAFLSGKGGSGKTTLALSMASLLAECGLKVLLIDCDLNTNGATYFFEKELANYEGQDLLSFSALRSPSQWNRIQEMKTLTASYDFVPSVTRINMELDTFPEFTVIEQFTFNKIMASFKKQYDFILFDCQAGYSDALELIIQSVDLSLTVMEADAVSSSAARALFWRIGRYMQNKDSFQIFNKATSEEKEIYSKVSGGTLFTNLGCISFDWQVRKAFSMLNAPSINNLGLEYIKQLYQLCRDLFGDSNTLNSLKVFQTKIEFLETIEEEDKVMAKIESISDSLSNDKNNETLHKRVINSLSLTLPILSIIAVLTVLIISSVEKGFDFSQLTIALSVFFILVFMYLSFGKLQKNRDEKYQKTEKRIALSKLENELNNIREKKSSLERNYAQQQRTVKKTDANKTMNVKQKRSKK